MTPRILGFLVDHLQSDDPPVAAHSPVLETDEIIRRLGTGARVDDVSFDRHLPRELRAASDVFWTPLDVVELAVNWFRLYNIRSIVDIGSGAGKFCVAAALRGCRH